jgi:hypothetical protein
VSPERAHGSAKNPTLRAPDMRHAGLPPIQGLPPGPGTRADPGLPGARSRSRASLSGATSPGHAQGGTAACCRPPAGSGPAAGWEPASGDGPLAATGGAETVFVAPGPARTDAGGAPARQVCSRPTVRGRCPGLPPPKGPAVGEPRRRGRANWGRTMNPAAATCPLTWPLNSDPGPSCPGGAERSRGSHRPAGHSSRKLYRRGRSPDRRSTRGPPADCPLQLEGRTRATRAIQARRRMTCRH